MDSVRALAAARNHVADKAEELTAAETADKAAHDAALRAGWTAEELRKVGLGPVATTRPTKAKSPARRRRTAATETGTGTGTETNTPTPADTDSDQQ